MDLSDANVRGWLLTIVGAVLAVVVGLVLVIAVKQQPAVSVGYGLVIAGLSAVGVHYANNVGPGSSGNRLSRK